MHYVDDTLVSIRPSDISAVLAKFNSFDPNLTFTVDTFSEGIVKSLYHRAFKICSTKSLLNNQIEIIKSFMS